MAEQEVLKRIGERIRKRRNALGMSQVSLLGNIVHANNEYVLFFNLNSPKYYPTIQKEDGRTALSRTEVYKEEWRGTFGMPYNEHQRYTQINVLKGFAVVAVEDRHSRAGKTAEDHEKGDSEDGRALHGSDIDSRPEKEQISCEPSNPDGDRDAQTYHADD